jgi:hypothetical protein
MPPKIPLSAEEACSGRSFAPSAALHADKTQVMMLRERSVFGVGVGLFLWKAAAQSEKLVLPHLLIIRSSPSWIFSATKSEFATCKIFPLVA